MGSTRLVGLVLVVLVPALGSAAAAWAADMMGRQAGAALERAVRQSGLFWTSVQPPPAIELLPEVEPNATADIRPPPSTARAPSSGRAARRPPTSPRAPTGVRVAADQVLRLARAGARPSGVKVPARGKRPPGLALRGVSALGIGVQDGDVLTHVEGQPVASVGAVIGHIVAARGAGAAVIHGRLWRGDRAFVLVVEQPYLKPEGRRPRGP
ncbi:MAG TPA: hypothetical protein VKZ49_01355 [Polyangiaceae bacterium]|nr:hypothetical protein [Polyangiaceae bacterium]